MDGSEALWAGQAFKSEILNIQGVAFALITVCLLALLWQRVKDSRVTECRSAGLDELPENLKKRIAVTSFSVISLLSFALYVYSWGWDRVLLAVGFALATALSIFRPSFSICFFLAILLLRPWEVMETNTLMLAMPKAWAALSIVSWIASQLFRGKISIYWSALCSVFLVFCVWVLLSVFKAPDVSVSLTDYKDTFFKSAAVFFLTLNLIEDELDLIAFRVTLVIGIIGLGFIGVYRTFFDPALQSTLLQNGPNRLQSYGLLGDPNYLSAILLIALPFVVRLLFAKSAHWLYRVVGALSLVVVALVIYLSKSRGALLSILVLGAFYLIMQIRAKILALVLGAGLVSALVPLTAFLGRGSEDLASSSQSRLNYWIAAWKMALRNPFFGVGFNRYKFAYESYAPVESVEWGERTAHSSWFLVLAETGFPGLCLYLAVFGIVIYQAWRLRVACPELIYAVVGYAVAISFLSHSFLIYPYILFAFAAVTYRLQGSIPSEKIEKQT